MIHTESTVNVRVMQEGGLRADLYEPRSPNGSTTPIHITTIKKQHGRRTHPDRCGPVTRTKQTHRRNCFTRKPANWDVHLMVYVPYTPRLIYQHGSFHLYGNGVALEQLDTARLSQEASTVWQSLPPMAAASTARQGLLVWDASPVYVVLYAPLSQPR